MSDTANFQLPLLASSQAQKHVTMNEALARLDALAAPTAASAGLNSPPPAATMGDAYVIAGGAVDAWLGKENHLAFWINDGWSFAAPRLGWRVWVADQGRCLTWTGAAWVADLVGPAIYGSCLQAHLISGDEALSVGAAVTTTLTIPDRAVVLGVTVRVLQDLTGTGLTGWSLGVSGSVDRYGNSIGLTQNSIANGVTGAPVAYFADTPLTITADGGVFDGGGVVRISIHYFQLTPPSSV